MSKKIWTLGVVLMVLVLAFSACQPAAPAAEEPAAEEPAAEEPAAEEPAAEEPAEEALKVAILLPGSANDQSWSQLGYEGVEAIGRDLGAETAYTENAAVADAIDALRDYAERGYNLILTHGGQYEEAVLAVADDYPDSVFVIIAGSVGGKPNVAIANVNDQQIGYTTGWIAANLTETKKIGLVSHLEGMPVMDRINGSQRIAAHDFDPEIEYCIIYIKDGEDVAAAREAAQSLIDGGVDVVYSEMNRGWQGVADAAKEAGVWTNSRDPSVADQYEDVLLFGINYGYETIFTELAKRYQEGTLGGESVDVGYHTPGSGFEFVFTDNVPQEIIDSIDNEVIPYFLDEVPNSSLPIAPEDAESGCK